MIVKTDAIVLNSFKYGESSKIVTLYTKEFGKIKVIAKGSRKAKNKFGSALDPMSYSQICFYQKPSTELYLLSDASHIFPLRRIQDSYQHLSAGLIIVEAINISQDVNDINVELFEISTEVLKLLNELPASPFSVSTYFLIKLSEIIGFAIDFRSFRDNHPEHVKVSQPEHLEVSQPEHVEVSHPEHVKVSHPELVEGYKTSEKVFFSVERGSFLNRQEEKNIFSFNQKTAQELFDLANLPINEIGEKILDNSIVKEFHEFFNIYFSYHLDRKNSFKTMNLFKSIL